MLKHLGQNYANITTDAVELFKPNCIVCQEKRKCPKTTGAVVEPILFSEFNSLCQVDLVNIPMADRDRGDPRNILQVIVDQDEHDMYRIAVKAGILSTMYSHYFFIIYE